MQHTYSSRATWPSRLFLLGLLTLGLAPSAVQAQAPTWNFVTNLKKSTSPQGEALVTATVANAAGDVYVAGGFAGTVTLGSTTLTSQGTGTAYFNDLFIAKWSRTTNSFVWAQRLSGLTDDAALAIALGPDGVYLAGTCGRGATFGNVTVAEEGQFLARVTDTGTGATVRWAQHHSLGGIGKLAVSGSNLYATGYMKGTVTVAGQTLTHDGGYLLRLTDTGTAATPSWIRSLGNVASDVAVSGSSVYVSGSFGGQATFGTTTLTSNAYRNGYVVKLTDSDTAAPAFNWVQQMGGPDNAIANAVAVSGTSVYVGGEFLGSSRIGNQTLTTNNYTNLGGFVTKLTDAGPSSSFMWAMPINNGYKDEVQKLVVQGPAVYVAGPTGTGNSCVGRFTDNGTSATKAWMEFIRKSIHAPIRSLAANSYGQVYLGGSVSGYAEFGSLPLTINIPYNAMANFWASIQDNTVLASSTSAAAAGLAIYPNPARTSVQVPAATMATTLTLTDALGRSVRTATGAALSVQGVAPGLYVLRAATPGQPVRMAKLKVE
ncbi:T9SS type A sorting domain-containing protein [Hymenobacter cellulosilyticus]|uniref:T9SS type A sorting domain-containing protein n=1 Tax=Hymenobacter cellulosilyticus TaxID=2932248 RepID=A0A8T9Q7P5_9BACT|nr:T9SS type A sorting domain-containing protein [Hymenobacter cellulosilyticus]UOQ72451.1 T9SS type A sorting domain-containing protein [Hymenobacter cellulosilyticus]